MDAQLTEPQTSPEGLARLSDENWLTVLDEIGEERGYFEPLGPAHSAIFTDRGPQLLVTFETQAGVRARDSQLPLGFDLGDAQNWSQLCILAQGETWFRDRRVYGYFDRLVDDGFFEDFDQVVFYGAGMCGYAACAFSVAAPGATVVAVAPQATLSPEIAGWDRRWPGARRLDFTDRYGYAPQMAEAASRVFLLYDPQVQHDAVHAGHFVAPHVSRLRMHFAGPTPEAALVRLHMLQRLLTRAMEGKLTPTALHRMWRARRKDLPYLKALAARLETEGRTWRLAKMARSVALRTGAKRFRRIAARAEEALEAEGRSLPAPRAAAQRESGD